MSTPRTTQQLNTLKWITAVVPAIAIVLAEMIRHDLVDRVIPANAMGNIIVGLLAFGCTYTFAEIVFRIIHRTQNELVRRNTELEGVNTIAAVASGAVDTGAMIQRTEIVLRQLLETDEVTVSLELNPGEPSDGSVVSSQPDKQHEHNPSDRDDADIRLPLESHRGVIGSIRVRRAGHALDDAERRLLHVIGDTISIAVENHYLIDQLRSAAIAEERTWLAREMHDGVAQLLASMLMQIDIVDAVARHNDTSRLASEIERLRTTAEQANAEVRAEIAGLRLFADATTNLLDRLRAYVDDFEDQTGIVASLTVVGSEPSTLSPQVALQLVRILQESLANVRKHSGASRVDVGLSFDDERATLSVDDNGRGFTLARQSGDVPRTFGLATMQERAESLGGSLNIDSAAESGTHLRAFFPIAPNGVISGGEATSAGRG